MTNPELIVDAKNRLWRKRECLWHPREQSLLLDRLPRPGALPARRHGGITTFPLPTMAGCRGAPTVRRSRDCVAEWLPRHRYQTGALGFIADPESDLPDNRVNDGSCDRSAGSGPAPSM